VAGRAGEEVRVQVPPAQRGRPRHGLPRERHRVRALPRHLRHRRCAIPNPTPWRRPRPQTRRWPHRAPGRAGGGVLLCALRGAGGRARSSAAARQACTRLGGPRRLTRRRRAQAATAWSTCGTARTRSGCARCARTRTCPRRPAGPAKLPCCLPWTRGSLLRRCPPGPSERADLGLPHLGGRAGVLTGRAHAGRGGLVHVRAGRPAAPTRRHLPAAHGRRGDAPQEARRVGSGPHACPAWRAAGVLSTRERP